jgi:hypothetical protein
MISLLDGLIWLCVSFVVRTWERTELAPLRKKDPATARRRWRETEDAKWD